MYPSSHFIPWHIIILGVDRVSTAAKQHDESHAGVGKKSVTQQPLLGGLRTIEDAGRLVFVLCMKNVTTK